MQKKVMIKLVNVVHMAISAMRISISKISRNLFIITGRICLYSSKKTVFLNNDHRREAMNIGESMNDESFIARMNFTIGRVYSLKQDYDTAIYFHEKHLQLARQLEDSIGQCRAYYFLSQLYDKSNQEDKAKKYDSLYKALAREVILVN